MDFIAVLLIILISLGSLLFLVGYGVLFISAFSINPRYSIFWLILLGFSGVLFLILQFPWYYALVFWVFPPIIAQFLLPAGRHKRLACLGFWLGILALAIGAGILYWVAMPYVQ